MEILNSALRMTTVRSSRGNVQLREPKIDNILGQLLEPAPPPPPPRETLCERAMRRMGMRSDGENLVDLEKTRDEKAKDKAERERW